MKPLFFAVFMAWVAIILGLQAGFCADSEVKRKLGLGLSYLGGDLHVGFKQHWAAELRYFSDKSTSDNGDVSANVFGGRIYRYFRTEKHLQTYVGVEGARVNAKLKDQGSGYSGNAYDTNGYAVGGYAGIEYYMLRRLSICLDLGPYYIFLKEKTTSTTDSGLDFVLNTSIHFYIF